MTDTFYITTPIYYVNAEPHLGHLYTTIVADALRRVHRQRGEDTYFLTGTDEHSTKIERAAEAAGTPVQEFVDRLAGRFDEIFRHWGLSYDQFIRTTSEDHKRGVQELWRRCEQAGSIYKGEYSGWYCIPDNLFVDGPPDGDPPQCPECGGPTEWVSEESYFFKLSAFQDRLIELYRAHPEFIQPDARRNEVVSFVESGLKDLALSRVTTSWGVPVPGDPKHVVYVWFDALSNYLTAVGFGNDKSELLRYWPATHLIGKDIVRFHTVYWPAFLMAAGVELPKAVLVHGMWLSGGRKMSKRFGNGVDIGLLDRLFIHDAVKYFCLAEMSFGQDGDFTYESLIDRTTADLTNGIGNLASRTHKLLGNFDFRVPDAATDVDVRRAVEEATETAVREFTSYGFRRGIESIREAIGAVDKLISATKPWELVKNDATRGDAAVVLVTAFEALRFFAVLLAPILPDTMPQLWAQLGLDGDPGAVDPRTLSWGSTPVGHRLGDASILFPRLNKKEVMAEIQKVNAASDEKPADAQPEPATQAVPVAVDTPGFITIEDLMKVELRVGEIREASTIEGADKLLKLQVDVGEAAPRQILAGIAQYYDAATLIGRKIAVVTNLKPRKMRGLESQGMLLAASFGEDGKPALATFTEDVPNGARLK